MQILYPLIVSIYKDLNIFEKIFQFRITVPKTFKDRFLENK